MQRLEENMKNVVNTVEEIQPYLHHKENGTVKQSIENYVYILDHDDIFSGAIKRNRLTCKTDIVKEMPWTQRGKALTDTDINNIRLYMEKNYGITSEKAVKTAIDIVANENSYNPIIDRLESLKWDGTARIGSALYFFFRSRGK